MTVECINIGDIVTVPDVDWAQRRYVDGLYACYNGQFVSDLICYISGSDVLFVLDVLRDSHGAILCHVLTNGVMGYCWLSTEITQKLGTHDCNC